MDGQLPSVGLCGGIRIRRPFNVVAVNTWRYNEIRMRQSKPYHHGNLREALLRAALRLISEVGPTAFTLRELARRANVSHNAPYRHFRDREALMAAVSTEGYAELTRTMQEAVEPDLDSLARLKQAGLAYVKFALRRPEHFTVMFDAPFSKPSEKLCFNPSKMKIKYPESAEAAEQSFRTLMNLVTGCQQEGVLRAGDTKALALLVWSIVHGIAKLAITGRFPFSSQREILKFAEYVIENSLPTVICAEPQCVRTTQ
jgi:AcrR family transcriptional regulator